MLAGAAGRARRAGRATTRRARAGHRRRGQGLLRRPRPEGDARRAVARLLPRLFARCGRMMMAIQSLPVPVIARVHGIATAAGCQLVAMCDLAVAARDARFAVSGVNFGLFCSTPSVALSRNLSRKAAFEMLVTGDFISPTRRAPRAWSTASSTPPARRRSRGAGREHRRQAARRHRDRQGAVLPPARSRHRRRLRRRRPDDGLQHDGRGALEGVQAFIDGARRRPPDEAPHPPRLYDAGA